MSPIWLEVVIGFVVPVGWGFWQLYTLRRDRERAKQAPPPAAPPPGTTMPPS
jgi:hypothetical protein